ncbi:MAG: SUMF1/EgtB/PvdO family nonheme iron enzyme [Planctomycetes bacterium]|nr:SUMF1/EgtB/PvdO family nonheme iron enzyme [Planctomycetota bacterium]
MCRADDPTLHGPSRDESTRPTLRRAAGEADDSPPPDSASPDGKYEIRGELGRGGLGRVLKALDRAVGREIALKVMREDVPAEYVERFLLEGRVTGRLEHPHIVPVYDVGVLVGKGGARQVYFTMKKIAGRDLGEILRDLARSPGPPPEEFALRRLVERFHDVCLAVAFAHSRGVIHRDLKPSNIMLGEFGETLLVDWGLAKVKDGPDPHPADERRLLREAGLDPRQTPLLTMEGDLLGTPAYMSPEQAHGSISEVDELSDVWSLGAILYEIMTLRPPFDGPSVEAVIHQVREGRVTPPSAVGPRPVPPELESICLRCLARERSGRYRSVEELAREVRLFLDGVKERERHHRLADEAVARAREELARYRRLGAEAREAAAAAGEATKQADPVGDKSSLWALENRARSLEREAAEAFSTADATVTTALGYERDHAGARRLKAELFWDRFVEAEESGDEAATLYPRAIVERYNDGPFDALLKGDGALTVRTRAWPCRCLRDGRDVAPEELHLPGYHPFSGRSMAGHKGAEGVPALEPDGPVRLKVHGESCTPRPVEGAHVWLWRYEEVGRLLRPVTPDGPGSAAPAPSADAAIDLLFGADSPYRPRGPGRYLGPTPIERLPIPMGSYLLLVAGPHETSPRSGPVPLRCPVFIPRCGDVEQQVTLFGADEVPPGFIPIPAGDFGYQGDAGNPFSQAAEVRSLDDLFIARDPVTCAEYREFLNDLARTSPDEARRRVPRDASGSGYCWPGPPYAIPTRDWLDRAAPGERAAARRLESGAAEWEEDWPVAGISWEDAMVYAAWRRRREGWMTTLPDESLWEKAARGPDRRWFPWGRHFDLRWCNASRSLGEREQPVPVHAFPHDESPYGVRGLVGNSRDLCMNVPGPERAGWRVARGGAWTDNTTTCRPTVRFRLLPHAVCSIYGTRLGAPVRLSRVPLISSPPRARGSWSEP